MNDERCGASGFNFPERPVPRVVTNINGTLMHEKIDEMDIYIWKKDYELVHNRKVDFIEKEKEHFQSYWTNAHHH